MSKRTSISNTAPATAEKQASAAPPAKQGRWGWPLRSQVDVSKPSSNPLGVESGSPIRTPSIPENSVGESVSPAQPDTIASKLPAAISSPKPTRANSAMLAQILDREAEQALTAAEPSRTSISSERPPQPQLPLSDSAYPIIDNTVNTSRSVDAPNSPNAQPVSPASDLKSPKRTWPPVQTGTKSQDPKSKEEGPLSSSRKSSISTLSTRRSSRNLPTWPPVSSFPADTRNVDSNSASSLPRSRNSIIPEDDKPTQGIQGHVSGDEVPLPPSPVKSDHIDDETGGELGKIDPQIARIPEGMQIPHEQAQQRSLSQIPGSFPIRSNSTLGGLVNEELENASGPSDSVISLSPVPELSKPVIAGDQDSDEQAPALTSNASDPPKATLRKASYETEKNPWDDESILKIGDARHTPAETKVAGGSSLEPGFAKIETGLGPSETQIPSIARKGSELDAKNFEPRAFEHYNNDKRVKFAEIDRESSSSGSITPTEQVNRLAEGSGAEKRAPLNSDAAIQAENGIQEQSASAIGKVGNEDTTSLGAKNSPTHNQFLPLLGPDTSREAYPAGPTLAPQSDVSSEDLSSVRGIKSKEASVASSLADDPFIKGEAPIAKLVKPETTIPESAPHFPGTDQKGKLPDPNPTITLTEDKGSFEPVGLRSDPGAVESQVLDLIIDIQAEVRQRGNPRLSNDIPKLETVRTVVAIPPSLSPDKRLSIPKIHVQNPTDVSEPELAPRRLSASRKDSLTAPRALQSAIRGPPGRRPTLPGTPPAFIDSNPAEDSITNEEPKSRPVKKRKLYVRKVRNVAARKFILKVTLGRELAGPTKRKLRRLAKGRDVDTDDIKTEREIA